MRWSRGSRSENIEDRRGAARVPGGRGTVAGVPALILLVLGLIFGGDVFGGGGGGGFQIPNIEGLPGVQAPAAGEAPLEGPDPDAELVDFVGFVLDDVQATWDQQFEAAGRDYQEATLVLFDGSTTTACGFGDAAIGPFYCPGDGDVYLDLSFFRNLASRFDAPGDFAQAYVIAHEIGHHVQNQLGTSGQVSRLQQEQPDQANELSVRLELQADCYAGVWAHGIYERDLLESGDLEEGLDAAAAVGDDTIQRGTTGQVNPESWTHGSSEQRMTWFRSGFDSGDPNGCDTFSGSA